MPSRPTCSTAATAYDATRSVQRGKRLRSREIAPWQESASVAAVRATIKDLGESCRTFGLRLDTDERAIASWVSGETRLYPHTLERDPEVARVFAQKWLEQMNAA